jgi:hypothetical protein
VDSSNSRWDTFAWKAYNREGDALFAILFDNTTAPPSLWYQLNDASGPQDAGLSFNNDTIYSLTVLMDFGRNTWEASLDGLTIAEQQPISMTAVPMNLGDMDAAWYWDATQSGNNFMLFDNYSVDVIAPLNPPVIVAQPQSQAVLAGASPVLSVTATGAPPISYQWFHNGITVSNATSAMLTLANVSTNKAGAYTVVVANPYGSVISAEAVLLVNLPATRPANDNFAARVVVAGVSNTVLGANLNATKETDEPLHAGNAGGRSVWWSWTAPKSGKVTISTVGSDFDTLLAVYTGASLAALAPIASNDDAQTRVRGSWVTFNAQSGVSYQIAVDGYAGDSGNIRLAIKPDATPQFSPAFLTGGFNLNFSGEQGLNFTLQVSSNLVHWVALTNLANPNGMMNFLDAAPNAPRRFYRIVQDQ